MPTDSVTVSEFPLELTTFVGRRQELIQITALLNDARLVTLTGAGGSGKTRLALRAAMKLRRAFPARMWFIDLTQLHDLGPHTPDDERAETLARLVIATLGVRGQDREPLRLLTDHLAGRPALLVLDNCEHLMEACAAVVTTLLRCCPNVRVLATSREPLAVPGETLFQVQPLSVPDLRQQLNLTDTARYESVALFVARGRAVAPGFELTADTQTAVAGVCHRLDGLPLAIELAAARLRVLSPQQILERLDHRFALLSRGSRTAPERQQTLEGCVTWSFDLCTEPERRLWARLAVFAGSFDLDAVEGVCADGTLPREDLLDLVAGLVDKSILIRDHHDRTARFRMLMTIRDYGLLKLREAGEEPTLRRRHANWYLRLAEQAEREWFGPGQIGWCRRMRLEHANLRAAFDFFLSDARHRQQAVRLAAALWFYWLVFGLVLEGRDWLRRATEITTEPTRDRAKALWVHGHLASVQGDVDTASRLLHQAYELAGELGDELTQARALKRLGAVAVHGGDLDRAEAMLIDALARLEALDGADASVAHAQLALALTRFLRGDLAGAAHLGQELRALCRARGDQHILAYTLNVLARAQFGLGDLEPAAAHVREAIRVRRPLPDAITLMFSIELLSWITAAAGDYPRAATLAGAADTIWQAYAPSVHRWRFLAQSRQQWQTRTREALGDAAYEAAARRGAQFTVEEIISHALEERAAPAPATTTTGSGPALTRREKEIAELLAQGLSNKEIAEKLFIGRRTVESHVEHILDKLGFTSRIQIVTWMHEQT